MTTLGIKFSAVFAFLSGGGNLSLEFAKDTAVFGGGGLTIRF